MACQKFLPNCPLTEKGELQECCQSHIKELTTYTCKLLSDNNIKYWIDYGSIYAALTNTILPQFNAISYIGNLNQISKLSHKVLEDGYYLVSAGDEKLTWLRIYYSRINLNFVDIIPCVARHNVIYHEPIYKGCENKFDPKYINPLETVDYFSNKVSCPNNLQEFFNLRKL